jgi:YHS domain-containing protein
MGVKLSPPDDLNDQQALVVMRSGSWRSGLLVALLLTISAHLAAQESVGPWTLAPRAKLAPPALGGYCVVTLRDRQQWQPGQESLSVIFDGRRYQFATERERDIFTTAPEAYVPMLAGDCPVTLAETDKRKPGQLEFGVLHGARLTFFASADDRDYFLEHSTELANVDLALGGQCIVSQRDRGRIVAGIPETAAVFRGMRYYFASSHDRKQFVENPAHYVDRSGSVAVADPAAPIVASPDNAAAAGQAARINAPDKARPPGSQVDDVILGTLPAMTGYCPVTLRSGGTWIRGRYEYRVDLGGYVFLTAGPKERELLSKQPEKYVPALGGECAVTLLARGERVRGSVYHAYEYDGRLFLFGDAERKALFKASPARYALADVAALGNCVVTKVDEQREAPGLAEHATWLKGKLYRFAGPEQKLQFLAAPEKYLETE